MTKNKEQKLASFYVKLMIDTANGIVKSVSESNDIPLDPTVKEFEPMPVFEEAAKASLLSMANGRAPTTLRFVSTSQNFVQAYWKRYRVEKRVRNEIVVTASNYCWARFWAAKELMHCFIDDDGHPASDSIDLVKDLIESLTIGNNLVLQECLPQTLVDEAAWAGACWYLVPQTWLPTLRTLHHELSQRFPDDNNYMYIAQLIRAPELVVRTRLKTGP